MNTTPVEIALAKHRLPRLAVVPANAENKASSAGYLWVSRLQGYRRTQGYEDADEDSLKPLMYIHLEEVDWKPSVNSGQQEGRVHDVSHVLPWFRSSWVQGLLEIKYTHRRRVLHLGS